MILSSYGCSCFERLDLLQDRLVFLVRLHLVEPFSGSFKHLLARLQLGVVVPPALRSCQLRPLSLRGRGGPHRSPCSGSPVPRQLLLLRGVSSPPRIHSLQLDEELQLFSQPHPPFVPMQQPRRPRTLAPPQMKNAPGPGAFSGSVPLVPWDCLVRLCCRRMIRVASVCFPFRVYTWWAHLDSNQGPTGYEPVALPIELWALLTGESSFSRRGYNTNGHPCQYVI